MFYLSISRSKALPHGVVRDLASFRDWMRFRFSLIQITVALIPSQQTLFSSPLKRNGGKKSGGVSYVFQCYLTVALTKLIGQVNLGVTWFILRYVRYECFIHVYDAV